MDSRSTHCYQGTSSLHNSTSPRAATTRQLHIMAIPTSLQKTGTVGHQMQWAKSPEAAVSHTAPDNTTNKHCVHRHTCQGSTHLRCPERRNITFPTHPPHPQEAASGNQGAHTLSQEPSTTVPHPIAPPWLITRVQRRRWHKPTSITAPGHQYQVTKRHK